MTDVQQLSQLKFRISALESALSDKQKQLEEYRQIESQADTKIKALNKMHADKIKSLLNSLQIVKKQKATLEAQGKEHKRSKLIEQLNKQISDQDVVIQVLRKYIYDDKGKQSGRNICDDIIVKALTKGPERIRPPSREELRMEIDKLKSFNLNLQGKLKNGGGNAKVAREADEGSEISSLSSRSFLNQGEEVYTRLKDLQLQNENIKLQVNAKGKIIERLKNEVKQKDKLKAQLEIMVNELQIAGRKIQTYEKILRETKEGMNAKIIQLYERQIKVQQLQMNSRQNNQKLKQAHQSTNILVEEMRHQKQQLQVELQSLKKQNQQLILENITNKKRQDQQKNKIMEIRQINDKKKGEITIQLKQYESQIQRILQQNKKYLEGYRNLQSTLFKQRAQWVEQRNKFIEQLQQLRNSKANYSLTNNFMEQIDHLRKDNANLKELLESGGGKIGDDRILLERLENYRRKLEFYEKEGKNDPSAQRKIFDEIYQRYNKLLEQFQQYKKTDKNQVKKKGKRKNIISMTQREQDKLGQLSSGISGLNLQDIGSDILDNFDSSFDYEIQIQMEKGGMKKMPKITEADRELLKLLNSNLWCFVTDDQISNKIDQVLAVSDQAQKLEDETLRRRIRQIKNLSHPQGKKLTIYEQDINQMDRMSENVSITSAVAKQIDLYDSDVNIEVKKNIKGAPNVNMRMLNNISDSFSSGLQVSSAKSGDSSFHKKQKKGTQKASLLKLGRDVQSSQGSEKDYSFNSDVSSAGIKDSQLDGMDSQPELDFKKKKGKK